MQFSSIIAPVLLPDAEKQPVKDEENQGKPETDIEMDAEKRKDSEEERLPKILDEESFSEPSDFNDDRHIQH
jgi:hypothetical protein